MALFSRRPKPTPAEPVEPAGEVVAADDTAVEAEPTASVGISVSSFQGLGTSQPAVVRPQASASEPVAAAPSVSPSSAETPATPVESVPGLRDNVLLRESLAKLPENPDPAQLLDLARQLLQGHLFLRVKGDARALIAEGKSLPLAVASVGDRRFALAYSSGRAISASIRADGDTATSAMGQSSITVLRHVRDGGLEGLIIDPASAPARAILPRALIERMLAAVDEKLEIKSLLAAPRTDATPAAIADAMTRAPMWIAVNSPEDGTAPGIAQGRADDGSRYLEIYTHPLEVMAMGRGDRSVPVTAAQLALALRGDDGIMGVIIDSQGPWIRLSRDELAPVFALAD